MAISRLDANQVLQRIFDENTQSLKAVSDSTLTPASYDEIDLGYTGSDITTVTYKKEGSPVATLTLTYDAPGGNLINVVRS